MTNEGALERVIRFVMVAVARVSAALLVVGLGWWLARPETVGALQTLEAGILLLMVVPLLRVLQSAARAVRLQDWLHVGTIAAVAALLAMTLLYASLL
ncbi:MAG: hypothetical protein H0T05_00080 [Acidobacteria bacterium]|nr:hypothetical protein [Acidobacteriota bacterium]